MLVEHLRELEVRELERPVAEALHLTGQVLADLYDLGSGEGRVDRDVPIDLPRLLEIGGGRLPRDHRVVGRAAGREAHAEGVGPTGDVLRRHRARAAAQERGRHVGDATESLRLDPLAAARDGRHGDDRRRVILLENVREAVREHLAADGPYARTL